MNDPGTPNPQQRRRPAFSGLLVAGVGILVVGVAIGLWVTRQRPGSAAPAGPGPAEGTPEPSPTPDEATLEALRSLGYLAPAQDRSPSGPAGPSPTMTPAGTRVLVHRTLPIPTALEPGRDYRVIRSARPWAALFKGTDGPVPEVSFDREMAVLLRDDLATDPPEHLVVVGVRDTGAAIRIECRRAPHPAGATRSKPIPPAQAVIVPSADRPIRIVAP